MPNDPSLPGLDHLLAVLRDRGARLEPNPPGHVRAGQPVLDTPLDPCLAAFYLRFDGGTFGDLYIVPSSDLAPFNVETREQADLRLKKLLRYGGIGGLAEDLATVPSLASPGGCQPVVYLESYMDKVVSPFASDVDRAFDLYARYCDEQISLCGSLRGDPPFDRQAVLFPFSFVEQVAQDQPLVQMLADGRMDELVGTEAASREWVRRILSAATGNP